MLKRVLIQLTVVVFCCSTVLGQKSNSIRLGIYIAPEFNILGIPSEKKYLNYPDKAKGKFGFSTGLAAQYSLNENFCLAVSLGYVKKHSTFIHSGLSLKQDFDSIKRKYTSTSEQVTNYNLNEINLPVLLIINSRKNRMFASIGAEITYVFNDQTERKYIFGKGGEGKIIQKNSNRTNIASILGFGYNVFNKKKKLVSIESLFKVFYKNYGLSYYNERGQMINIGLKTTFFIN